MILMNIMSVKVYEHRFKKHMIKYDIKKILYFQKRGRMGPYLVLFCLF
jgi:hypothetical protein